MTDINPNNLIGSITFTSAILWLLSLATLIGILDWIGLMPSKVAKWLARNRLDTTLQALKRLGVKVSWQEDKGAVTIFQALLDKAGVKELEYKTTLRSMLSYDTYESTFEIGDTRTFTSESFIDVMGGSTNSSTAIDYAKLLNTHASIEKIVDYHIVATPKTGSPILGYEFSKLVSKPFILGMLEKNKIKEKGGRNEMKLHGSVDFPKSLSLAGKTILIVDDSTTGGRKMVGLIEKLRQEGATITDALVLFEPKGKGARESLEKINVKLHAIVDGPKGKY